MGHWASGHLGSLGIEKELLRRFMVLIWSFGLWFMVVSRFNSIDLNTCLHSYFVFARSSEVLDRCCWLAWQRF